MVEQDWRTSKAHTKISMTSFFILYHIITGKNWLMRHLSVRCHPLANRIQHKPPPQTTEAGYCQDLWHTMAFLPRIASSSRPNQKQKYAKITCQPSESIAKGCKRWMTQWHHVFRYVPRWPLRNKTLQARYYHPAMPVMMVRCASLWSRWSSTIPECRCPKSTYVIMYVRLWPMPMVRSAFCG